MADRPEKCSEIPLSVKIPGTLLRRAKRAAEHDGHLSVGAYIKLLITKDLAEKEAEAESLRFIFADGD